MAQSEELAGKRFVRILILHRVASDRHGKARFLCRCDCGREFEATALHLRRGDTSSCGCLRNDRVSAANRRHGHTAVRGATPEYRSWSAAKTRCFNPNADNYEHYGGRGITMCADWRDSFETFLADMGPRPAGTSLDRYPDNAGDYEPGNCRWATARQQRANQRGAGQ